MSGQSRSIGARTIRCGLAALAPVYGVGAAGRNLTFDLGLRRPRRLDRPVISVGNLTVGGTGKTPMVLELVRRLKAMGQQPAVLMRGYGASFVGSDEATLLAEEASVLVAAQANRFAAGLALLAKQPQVSLFVLDDAFQHRQLHRDLNLLLIDATEPFGFRRLLPRGLLRESERGARRADAVIVTHAEQLGEAQMAQLDQRIEKVAGRPPLAHAEYRWRGFRGLDGRLSPIETLAGARVLAFCGIANPQAFSRMLAAHVAEVVDLKVFADHHPYADAAELDQLINAAKLAGADALLTTDKDWVKLRGAVDWDRLSLPLYRAVLDLWFRDGQEDITQLLAQCVTPVQRRSSNTVIAP